MTSRQTGTLMSSHPDANAFMRGYLRNPTDLTTRLVFADWLEETGTSSNVAWGHFIRLKAEADRYPFGSVESKSFEKQAKGYASSIEANLTIPASLFVGYPKSLLQLLPARNYIVKLEKYEIPPAARDFIPQSVAMENHVVPLDSQKTVLLVATANLDNIDLVQKLEFILNKEIVAVGAEAMEIRDVIDRTYELIELLSLDSPTSFTEAFFYERRYSIIPENWEVEPLERLIGLMLSEARQQEADRILISPIGGASLRFRSFGDWSRRQAIPLRLLNNITLQLCQVAEVEEEFRRFRRARGTFPCRVNGVPFTTAVTIESLDEGPVIQLDLTDDRIRNESTF
jgi:type IV pilus assembly protein PilB